MDQVDWKKFAIALVKFLLTYFAPAMLTVAAYDQCVCKPAIQKSAMTAQK
jgi:hypothetical protein